MIPFESIKPGARLRGLDAAGVAEIVQVARFGPDALNLVFRVNGRSANGSSTAAKRPASSSSRPVGPMRSTPMAGFFGLPRKPIASAWPTCSTPTLRSAPRRSRRSPTRSPPSTARCCRGSHCASCSPTTRRRQDDHGGAAHQGASDPRRPGALPDRRARAAWSSSGRMRWPRSSASPSTFCPATRSRLRVTGNPFAERNRADRPPRHGGAVRRTAGQAGGRAGMGPRHLRRGAPDGRVLFRRRGEGDPAPQARQAARRAARATSF